MAVAAAVALALAVFLVPSAQAASSTVTVLDHATKPANPVDPDNGSVELGLKFTSSQAGTISAIEFYRSAAQDASYTGSIWSASGTRLATATFPASTTVGWQTAELADPVTVSAGQTLVASYFAPSGGYPSTEGFFSSETKRNGFTIPVDAGVYRYGYRSGFPSQTYRASNYFVDVAFQAADTSTSPSASPTSATPSADPTSATPTASPTSATPTASGSSSTGSSSTFPSASDTGVPAGTTLTPYSGPCTITTDNTVIDAKTIDCSLTIRASGVVVSRSTINGSISNDTSSSSFTIRDSDVNVGNNAGTGIGNENYTAQRVHVTGGNRSANCDSNCTIEDSYVHGQFRDSTGVYHESGIRMGENTVLRHNTIACDAPDVPPDAGCSADLTGYGDFAVVQNNLIENNLLKASTGGYCAYGGSTTGKPYSSGTNNIRFVDNVFERGTGGKCGYWGPITSFDSNAPGNSWSGNTWDDGGTVPPAN